MKMLRKCDNKYYNSYLGKIVDKFLLFCNHLHMLGFDKRKSRDYLEIKNKLAVRVADFSSLYVCITISKKKENVIMQESHLI